MTTTKSPRTEKKTKSTPKSEGKRLYDTLCTPQMVEDTAKANAIISESLKLDGSEAIENYLAGIIGGFLVAHDRPLAGFTAKVIRVQKIFGGAKTEMEGLMSKITDSELPKGFRKRKPMKKSTGVPAKKPAKKDLQ